MKAAFLMLTCIMLLAAGPILIPPMLIDSSIEALDKESEKDSLDQQDHFVRVNVIGGGFDTDTRTVETTDGILCGGGTYCDFPLDVSITAGGNPASYDVLLWINDSLVFSKTYSTSSSGNFFEGYFRGYIGDTFKLQAGEAPDSPPGSPPEVFAELTY